MNECVTYALIIMFWVSHTALAQDGVVLVRNGGAQAVIVTPDKPSEAETLAAEQLGYYLKKISGAVLPIVTESRAPAGQKVFVGRTDASADLRRTLKTRKAPEEASIVKVVDESVRIVGVDDPGTVHATYFLLEDLGVRWYFPGEWGTIIPQRADVVVPARNKYRAPDFVIRAGLTQMNFSRDTDSQWAPNEWGRGNHLGGWGWWGEGHSYKYFVDHNQINKHPDWFALVEGKRDRFQLCTTHPEVRRMALKTIKDNFARGQIPRLIGVSPNDAHALCTCDVCRKLIPPEGGSIDRIVEFANYIADAIRDDHPNHYVTYYCDYHSVGTPKLVTPAKNTVFWVAQWSQDQFHGVTPSTPMGQSLERWSQYGNPMFLYTYYGSYMSWTFWPQVHAIRNDIPYYKRKGVMGLYSETHTHWGTQHLNFIVFPRLLWDVSTDVDALIDEFCEKFYGPAAAPMRKYYEILETTAERGPPQYHLVSELNQIFTPVVMERLRQLIKQATEAVKGHDEVYGKRMAFVAAGFRHADLFHTAEHLKRRYARTRDPALAKRIEAMYAEALSIIRDPRYRNRLTENRISEGPLNRHLADFRGGTRFPVGMFSYSDGYERGGNVRLHSALCEGFEDGYWGLDLRGGRTGTVIYHLQAEAGVFDSVQINSLSANSKMETRLHVANTLKGPWRMIAPNKEAKADGRNLPLDLTEAVNGKRECFLKITVANISNGHGLAVDQLTIEGKVVAAE